MMTRKLGREKALMVRKAFEKDPQHFGFIKITNEELSELTSLYSPSNMPYYCDIYCFRAGVWMVIIISHVDWVEVTLANPYDVNDHNTT